MAGLAVVLLSLRELMMRPVSYEWFVLAGLTLLSGSFTVKVPTIPARLSVSETFVFAAVLLFGPSAATMIVVLDSLVISLWIFRTSRRAERVLFNFSAPAIAVWIAAKAFYVLAGIEPLALAPQPILSLVFPLLILAVLYFLLNSWLIAVAVAFEQHTSAFQVWRRNFLWLSLNFFSGASVAALLIPYLQVPGPGFIRITGVLLPLLLIPYLTLRTALGRVEDANKHLAELNKLYLSTIETLAMAIDAKDQITHGHIRRVQTLAVGLAHEMGVNDTQIRAVEAAALLHDMGKLAVPEYILNKPGPLTVGEFEKMKLHASVGADILSAIDFPDPVVPIVRYHHERWDGNGYPDGLKGSEIPIGARILSVVDCFDALTSDRPYRPRLSDAEAIRILTDRRGSMYDPLIVDVFVRIHKQLVPANVEPEHSMIALSAVTRGALPTSEGVFTGGSRLDDISASTEEMLLLYELAQGLSGKTDLADAADLIAKHLRRLVPATTCVFFLYDPNADELGAAHAAGENASHFASIRIAMGQRLTGWVAANRQTILNSDPMLDLGEVARALRPALRSCLSTPLIVGSELVGVLTVYSTHRDAFTEEHRRIVEVVARQVSQTVQRARGFREEQSQKLRDQLTGLPNRHHLEKFLNSELSSPAGLPCSILLIDALPHSSRLTASDPSGALARVAQLIRLGLRGADLLFTYDSGRFVVLMAQTDPVTADAVQRRVTSELVAGRNADGGTVGGVQVSRASSPEDGTTLSQLVRAAEERAVPPTSLNRPSVH
jgi:putative nucleotidyltransferase with HDIG domain